MYADKIQFMHAPSSKRHRARYATPPTAHKPRYKTSLTGLLNIVETTMVLVDYSDSEEDEQVLRPPAKKRKISTDGVNDELPPLPASFLDQYSSNVRTSTQDDPSLHGGRKRVIPHAEGNWPTHVYLECKWIHHLIVAVLSLRTRLLTRQRPVTLLGVFTNAGEGIPNRRNRNCSRNSSLLPSSTPEPAQTRRKTSSEEQ